MTATTEPLGGGVYRITIPVTPLPAPRPKFSKFGAYYPATYKAYQKALAAAIPKPLTTLLGELAVTVESVCTKPKTSKFTTPAGDCDNLAKGPLDALTKAGWYGDDRQIVDLRSIKRFPRAGETPHTIITIKDLSCDSPKSWTTT